MRLGCIKGRRFALLLTAHNRAEQRIELLGAGGTQTAPAIIERVAVQVSLAPPPSPGSILRTGLRPWSREDSPSVEIPPGGDAWIQLNFLMRNCRALGPHETRVVNRSITLTYSADGSPGTETVQVRGARIFLSRGPLHPSFPINHVG
jgi:hypothetical protein